MAVGPAEDPANPHNRHSGEGRNPGGGILSFQFGSSGRYGTVSAGGNPSSATHSRFIRVAALLQRAGHSGPTVTSLSSVTEILRHILHCGNQILKATRPLDLGSTCVLFSPRDIPQLFTLSYPLPTIHYPTTPVPKCPILFRPVPLQIRTVGHHLSHFSEKCPIAQIGMEHFGTQWDTSHGESTTQPLTKALTDAMDLPS